MPKYLKLLLCLPFAVLVLAFAHSGSAVAATTAFNCSHIAAPSHRGSGSRSLNSAKLGQLHSYCVSRSKAQSKVNFIKHHRVLIAPRYKKWWNVPDRRWRKTVRNTRKVYQKNQAALAWLSDRIEKLSAPRLVLGDIAAWSCIHSGWKGNVQVGHGEGPWDSNTGKYDGGLQMDLSFQGTYGPPVLGFSSAKAMFAARGTADHWTKEEQMAVAEYARSHGRGYGPWPNTARDCNLL